MLRVSLERPHGPWVRKVVAVPSAGILGPLKTFGCLRGLSNPARFPLWRQQTSGRRCD